jgi:hypothetical protein
MSIGATHSMSLTTLALLQEIDLRYETENRLAWDEQERPKRSNGANKHRSRSRKEHYAIVESAQKGGMEVTERLVWFLDCLACDRQSRGSLDKSKAVQNTISINIS